MGRIYKLPSLIFLSMCRQPIYVSPTDEFRLLEWTPPNMATIVVPGEPNELSNGIVYVLAFVTLATAIADDPNSVPPELAQSVFGHATSYEIEEIKADCEPLSLIYCDLFIVFYGPRTAKLKQPPIPVLSPTRKPTTIPASTPSPATDAIPAPDGDLVDKIESLVHMLVNNERKQRDIPLLTEDNRLAGIAREHSQDMSRNDYFYHQSLTGQDPSARATSNGYTCRKNYGFYYTDGIVENIFQNWRVSSTWYIFPIPIPIKNYSSPEEIATSTVLGWMDSQGHRENILNLSYDRVGTGVAVSPNGKVYITQNFC